MKKLLFLALLLPALAKSQDVDSLKRYNDRYTKSAISAFTYNRLHTLINNMLTLIGQGGGGGGTTVAMRSNGGYIQVQYNGGTWNNLVELSELTGPQGIQGTPGTNGTDGREIELTTTATHIQWRYVGGSYTNLVALSALGSATTDAAALITGVLSNDRLQNIPLNKLAQSGAVAGSVIKWNGSAWAIGTDNTGGGGGAVNSVNSQQGDVVLNQDNIADGTTYKQYSQTEKTKLAGIEAGASNARANHTGVQAQSTITNLTTDLAARLNLSDTSTMLTAYRNGLNARVRYTDTAAMLLPYANKINTKIGVTDTASMLAAYQAALNEVVDIPIDEFPTLGSTNPATSGGIRAKLDSIVANMGTSGEVLATGLYTAMSSVTVPAGIDIVQTSGYGAIGRGAARYARTATAGAATWKFQSADGQWWELAEPVLNIDMFGAVGDGTTNNTTVIQSAIDYAAAGGTLRNGHGATVYFTNGLYLSNQVYMKSGVYLSGGGRVSGKGGFSPGSSTGGGLKGGGGIPADSAMITSLPGSYGWGLNGLQIIGAGSSSTSKGVRVYEGRDFMITNNTIKDWGLEALDVNGNPFTITRNMVQGLNNRAYLLTKAVPTGAIRASGVDGTITNNEFTGSANFAGSTTFAVSGADMYLSAAYFGGLEISKMTNNIYQVADAGMNHPGNKNTYTSERFDTNAGHGIYLANGGSDNRFITPTIERNSIAGNNLYDGVYAATNGGRNKFLNPVFYAGAPVGVTTYNMRYFINDTKTDYAHEFKNHYEAPQGYTVAGTAFYNFPAETEAGMSVSIADDVIYRLTGNNATPSVLNKKFLRAYNSTFTTITNFLDAVPGQIIYVIGNNTGGNNTRLAHGTNIKLRKGAGYDTLSMDVPKMFINRGTFTNNIWIELSGDQVISSGTASTAWADITEKPTTVAGYGITDAATTTQLAAKMDTTANISGAATKASATWAAGTVTVNSNTQRHDILMTAAGARTLVVSNINTVRSVVMWIDNTSGGTVTLTLPANSFVQNPTTGVYGSTASVVIAQGKTVLTLSNFDGTNYWFNY